MSLLDPLKRLFQPMKRLFQPNAKSDPSVSVIQASCNRCGEVLEARVNLYNDLSVVFGDEEGEISYFCRKVLVGNQGCFQRIEVELTFDRNRRLTGREITGGKFI